MSILESEINRSADVEAAERYFSVRQVADQFSVSDETIRRQIKGGAIHAERFGGVLRVGQSEVQRLRRERW